MKVVSLFDGICGAYCALDKLGIKPSEYYAFEIDKYAMQIAKANYPDIIHCGSVVDYDFRKFKNVDLLIMGFPCTSLSIAKRQKESGLEKGESVLFQEGLRALKEIKSKYFLFENVASMKNSDRDKISEQILKTYYPREEWEIIEK